MNRIASRRLAWATWLVAATLAPVGVAAGQSLAPSLDWVPADAAFYSASLRSGEQFDAIAASGAAARIQALPAVQRLRALAEAQIEDPESPAFFGWQMLQLPENQRLLALGGDLLRNEVVFYGGRSAGETLALVQEISNRANFLPLKLVASGRFDQFESEFGGQNQMPRMVLELLRQRSDSLQVPEFVIAFRVTDRDRAAEQLKRLEIMLNLARAAVDEEMPGEIRPQTAGEFSGLAWTISGQEIPFEEVPWEEFEATPGEFDDVVNQLRRLNLVLAVGSWRDYVVVSVGGSLDHLAALGEGASLGDRPEWEKLAHLADESICSVTYTSGEFLSAANGQERMLEIFAEIGEEVRTNEHLTADERERIADDVAELISDVKRYMPEFGPAASAQYFAPGGVRGLSYNWTDNPLVAQAGPLSLLRHVGDSPWLVAVGRGRNDPAQARLAAKWFERFWGYGEYVLEKIAQEEEEAGEALVMLRALRPHVDRLGEIYGTQLAPALADGQFGLVIDGKLRSSEPWADAVLPFEVVLPEPALLVGVSDAELLVEALDAVRLEINAAWATIVEHAPPGEELPEFALPAPEMQSESYGNLYYYPLPPGLVDPQISPNAALGDSVAAVSGSFDHSLRLLEDREPNSTVLDFSSPACGVFRLDMEAVWTDLEPLVQIGLAVLAQAIEQNGDDLEELQLGPIAPQLAELFAVVKTFRGVEAVTRRDEGIFVTESFVSVEDLAAP